MTGERRARERSGRHDLGVFLASFLERTESQARLVVGEGVAGAEDIVTAAPGIAKVMVRRRQNAGAPRARICYISGPGRKQPKIRGCRRGETRSTSEENRDFSCPRGDSRGSWLAGAGAEEGAGEQKGLQEEQPGDAGQ
jgi:hypothetical protein